MVEQAVIAHVKGLLASLESAHGVRVLLAVESGSRAWGFPSRDSDYDVRFVYVRPKGAYLSIDSDVKRDVIELPIENQIDLNGWDIRKALRLFAKANPPLIEWLSSPTIYKEVPGFRSDLIALLPIYYQPRTCMYHYLHMATNNRRDYLEGPIVWIKKYLYVLRPLLAVRWIEQGRGPVPMAFSDLLATITDQPYLVEEIQKLIDRKRSGDELDRGGAIPTISDFVSQEMRRQSALLSQRDAEPPDLEPLNSLFVRYLVDGDGQPPNISLKLSP